MKALGSGLVLVVTILAAVAGTVVAVNADPELTEPRITSWADVETAPLNAKIRRARAANETWTSAPHIYVFSLFEAADPKDMVYRFKADRIEHPRRLDIRLVRDGFADDSVRGDVHDITLKNTNGKDWEVISARQARRCWRTEATTYSSKPCH